MRAMSLNISYLLLLVACSGSGPGTSTGNTLGSPLKIYRIGGGDIPVAEYAYGPGTTIVPTERAIAVINYPQSKFEVIDLGGAELTRTEHELARETNSLAHIDGGLRWAVTTFGNTMGGRDDPPCRRRPRR
ncbi:hypothetical protein WME91_54370 [Sorangium sp. So ce269]